MLLQNNESSNIVPMFQTRMIICYIHALDNVRPHLLCGPISLDRPPQVAPQIESSRIS